MTSFEQNRAMWNAVSAGSMDDVDALLMKGVNIDHQYQFGKTFLFAAVENGHLEMVKSLIAKGASLDILDSDNRSVLHVAVEGQNVDILSVLCAAKVSESLVNTADKYGQTALYFAEAVGRTDLAQLLISAGADPAKTFSNPASSSASNVTPSAQAQLDRSRALWNAVSKGNTKDVEAILAEKSVDVNFQYQYGKSFLFAAAECGFPEVLKLLLAAGASLDVMDDDKRSVLHIAVDKGNVDILGILLSQTGGKVTPALLNSEDMYGHTALYFAEAVGQKEIASMLISAGADPTKNT